MSGEELQRLASAAELVTAGLERAEQPGPENTERAYRQAWERWERWCVEAGCATNPVHPVMLVGLLEQMAQAGLAHATLELTLSGISVLDVWARVKAGEEQPTPVRAHVQVRRFMRQHERATRERTRRQAPALLRPELVQVVAELAELKPQRGVSPADVEWLAHRDHALLLVGWFGALRTDSIARLRVSDLRGQADGLEVVLRAGKTDQAGHGDVKYLYTATVEQLCPLARWEAWELVRGEVDPESPAFPARDGARLSPQAVGGIVRRRCAAAGVRASGHSLRAGLATWAKLCGKSEADIRAHGGWRTTAAMEGYFRRARAREQNPTRGLV